MKKIDLPSSEIKLLFLMVLSFVLLACFGGSYYKHVYDSIDVVVVDNAVIEYGSSNYDIKEFIKEIKGDIVSISDAIDTSVLGNYEVVLELQKNHIVKEIPIIVSVVDTSAPEIHLREDTVTIVSGEDYDLTYNIESVSDSVDGDIYYSGNVDENSTLYYNFSYDTSAIDDIGTHEVTVNAKDSFGNLSTLTFVLEVVAPPVSYTATTPVYNNLPANESGNDIVSLAYSYIGYPYVAGSNGPYGFDCSGFVQFLYSQFGKSISRSTSTQLYDGLPVSYDSAQPGDILIWGYSDVATHSALYIGNGQMIHATNPSQGVLLSDVAGWTRGSGTYVISVRRIQ